MNVISKSVRSTAARSAHDQRARCAVLRFAAAAMLPILPTLLLAGCSDDDGDESGSSSSVTTSSSGGDRGSVQSTAVPDSTLPTPEGSAAPDTSTGGLDAHGAIAVAVRTTPGAAVEIGRDTERGQAVWEVTVRRDDGQGVEHDIAIATGEVLGSEPAQVPATLPPVTIEQAITTATQTVPGEVLEADLEVMGRQMLWEVDVRQSSGQRIEVRIDANSGEVVSQRPDS